MSLPANSRTQEQDDYIVAMLESFEHENPGVAEMLALHDRAMQQYVKVIDAYHQPVVRTSSSHTLMTSG